MKKPENFGFAKISHRVDPCQQNKKSAGYAGLMRRGVELEHACFIFECSRDVECSCPAGEVLTNSSCTNSFPEKCASCKPFYHLNVSQSAVLSSFRTPLGTWGAKWTRIPYEMNRLGGYEMNRLFRILVFRYYRVHERPLTMLMNTCQVPD